MVNTQTMHLSARTGVWVHHDLMDRREDEIQQPVRTDIKLCGSLNRHWSKTRIAYKLKCNGFIVILIKNVLIILCINDRV